MLLYGLLIVVFVADVASAQSVPAGAVVAFNEGKRLLKERRTDDAISKLEQAVKLAPAYGEAWTELGNAYLEKQDFQSAIRAFGTALDAKPDHTVARYNLAFSLRKIGRFDLAAQQYRLYLQAQPNDSDAHYGLAEALRAGGDKLAAADAYEAYADAEKNPAQQRWVTKARETAAELRAEASTGEKPAVVAPPPPKAAPKPVAKAKATDASQGGLHLSFSEKAPAAGTGDVKPGLEGAPVRKGARPEAFRAGLTYLQNGDYATALPRLVTADREMPNDGLILAAIASAHLGLSNGKEAETMYQQAIGLAAADALPGLYLGLGEARRLLGKNDQAIEAYNRALAHERATLSIKRFSQERIAALQ